MSKSLKLRLLKSILYVKNHLNLFDFFFIEEYEFRSPFFALQIAAFEKQKKVCQSCSILLNRQFVGNVIFFPAKVAL